MISTGETDDSPGSTFVILEMQTGMTPEELAGFNDVDQQEIIDATDVHRLELGKIEGNFDRTRQALVSLVDKKRGY